jgi:DnaJ domain
VKTHYQLLGLEPTASAEEIKRAFRREIARYHPDKVQHLGTEFQAIAAGRAADLTNAYRVLMDPDTRSVYDESLRSGVGFEPPPAPRPSAEPAATIAEPLVEGPSATRFRQERATGNDVVRRAAIGRLRDALGGVSPSAASVAVAGFDAAYVIKPQRSLFQKSEPQVRLLARFVEQVDGAALKEAWPLAAKAGAFDGVVCVMLLGSGMSSAKELGVAVAEQRRKTRTPAPVVVPVNVRNWEALFPPEAPQVVRQVVQRLRTGA